MSPQPLAPPQSPQVEQNPVEGAFAASGGSHQTASPAAPALESETPPSDTEVSVEPFEAGYASWYGAPFHKRRTASGERFDMHAYTAAHPSLPFGTSVCVHSPETGKTVQVRINDRGPHTRKRIMDLSHAAAKALGIVAHGVKHVELMYPLPDTDACPERSSSSN